MNIYKSAEGERAIRERYLRFLEHWPVPHQRLTVPTREGGTFVIVSGPENGPPVVVLHGSSTNTMRWMGSIKTWSEHLRVYVVDAIGEPGLSAPSRPPLDSDSYTLWLDDVLRELSLTATAMVGESLGGWWALDYATNRPERITRLAVLTPPGLGRQKVGILVKAALLRPFGERGRRRAFRSAVGLPSADKVPAGSPMAAVINFGVLVAKNFRPRRLPSRRLQDKALRQLTMPVLAVLGGRDAFLDHRQTARRLAEAVPAAEVRLLPEAGHLLLDQTAAIMDFLTPLIEENTHA